MANVWWVAMVPAIAWRGDYDARGLGGLAKQWGACKSASSVISGFRRCEAAVRPGSIAAAELGRLYKMPCACPIAIAFPQNVVGISPRYGGFAPSCRRRSCHPLTHRCSRAAFLELPGSNLAHRYSAAKAVCCETKTVHSSAPRDRSSTLSEGRLSWPRYPVLRGHDGAPKALMDQKLSWIWKLRRPDESRAVDCFGMELSEPDFWAIVLTITYIIVDYQNVLGSAAAAQVEAPGSTAACGREANGR